MYVKVVKRKTVSVFIARLCASILLLHCFMPIHPSGPFGRTPSAKKDWVQVKIRSASVGAEDDEEQDLWHISHGQRMPWTLEMHVEENFKKNPNSQDNLIFFALYALKLGLSDEEESLEKRTKASLTTLEKIYAMCGDGISSVSQNRLIQNARHSLELGVSDVDKTLKKRTPKCLSNLQAMKMLCEKQIDLLSPEPDATESTSATAYLPKSPRPQKFTKPRSYSEGGSLCEGGLWDISSSAALEPQSPMSPGLPIRTASAPLPTIAESSESYSEIPSEAQPMSLQNSPELRPASINISEPTTPLSLQQESASLATIGHTEHQNFLPLPLPSELQ